MSKDFVALFSECVLKLISSQMTRGSRDVVLQKILRITETEHVKNEEVVSQMATKKDTQNQR